MNKEELRTHYVGLGWTAQPVADWRKVSDVEGVEKYDVNVVSPDNVFGTAQVVVRDGVATAEGMLKDKVESFTEALRTHARSFEAEAPVFAVKLGEVSEQDEVGEVTVYNTDGSTVSYVVKRRDGAFEHQALV